MRGFYALQKRIIDGCTYPLPYLSFKSPDVPTLSSFMLYTFYLQSSEVSVSLQHESSALELLFSEQLQTLASGFSLGTSEGVFRH